MQGKERKVIVVSTVLTRSRGDNASHEVVASDESVNKQVTVPVATKGASIGFLRAPKRFNVALTRAKALTIVVGHPMLLAEDPYWRAMLQYCVNNDAYVGCKGCKCPIRYVVTNLTFLASATWTFSEWDNCLFGFVSPTEGSAAWKRAQAEGNHGGGINDSDYGSAEADDAEELISRILELGPGLLGQVFHILTEAVLHSAPLISVFYVHLASCIRVIWSACTRLI